jgi:hypothetical protein
MWNTDRYHHHYVETETSATCDTAEESRIRRTTHAADTRRQQGMIFEGVTGKAGDRLPMFIS